MDNINKIKEFPENENPWSPIDLCAMLQGKPWKTNPFCM